MSCQSWDIFCTVIDNFGDAGVCWRLARQLAREYGFVVRLWIDRPAVLSRLVPAVQPDVPEQSVSGVEVRRLTHPFPQVRPHEVVIEAFGCALPENFVEAMARRTPAPMWINLEYLSAEDWVAHYHALASPHPRLPLVKYFFFPGFGPNTGGLLREADLFDRRAAFQADPTAQAAFWQGLGVPPPQAAAQRISLFAYENAAVAELLRLWVEGPDPVFCLLPEGRLLPQAAAALGEPLATGRIVRRGRLTLHVLPFLPQDEYDRLLWACDFNFVRGEDSFVRAQWAARPFAWHIYAQDDEVHWRKLNAFLAVYGAGLAPAPAAGLAALWHAWNRQAGVARAWQAYVAHAAALADHARRWAAQLGRHPSLAQRLVQFCEKRL
ncbi:elongation factor P maturation arginine rhamnosyltransferase EarP [Thiobacter sp. AK1]|uniref:Protein-arginine rhamnosyltransferase n=2 Tax=Thiobacter aerophilum TaxID=3121275 RepID=A0ABV0EBC7_9BURK